MRIDILIAVAEKGGVENVINMLVPHLEKYRGWDVRVVQLVWEGKRWTDEGTQYYPLLYGKDGHTLDEFVRAYASFIKENGTPDIVLATAWPYMCQVAKLALEMIDSDVVKVISWLHAPVERYKAVGYGGYEQLASADAHLAISQTIYDGIRGVLPESCIGLVYNPVDFDKCRIKLEADERKVSKDGRNLYFIGRISKEKRLDVIINAIAANEGRWNLYIIGSGNDNYETQIKTLIQERRAAECVHWLGWQENPWEHVKDADAVVLASEYEGFPLAAIEALANGIPVISTPVSGIVELIKPGVNGYLYPKDDWKMLAKILQMISIGAFPKMDAEECRRSVQKFDAFSVLENFSAKLEEIVLSDGKLEEIYSDTKISVIVPSYNAEKYIEQCILSLINQTIPLDMMELIFVDDDSQDDTCAIIQRYEQQYQDIITLIACQKNGGPGTARNIGLSYATGKYVAFVDADDKAASHMLQKMYEKITSSMCDMVGCGYRLFNDNGAYRDFVGREAKYNLCCDEDKKRYILENGSRNAVWRHMYRRMFLEENAIRFPESIYMEDVYFHIMCMMQAKTCYEMEDILYWYRENANGIMRTIDSKHLLDIVKVQDMTYKELVAKGLQKGFEEELAVLYYVKAFVEPISNMEKAQNGIEWNDNIVEEVKEAILNHFPNISCNTYLNQDTSDYNKKYLRMLL